MSNHIVFIINSLESRSGSERVACLLANLFVEKLGYNVTILNRITEKNDVVYFLSESINVLAFKGNTLHFLKNVQNYVDENKPKAIVVHNMGKLSLLFSFLKKNQSKLISLEHGAFISRPIWIKVLAFVLYRRMNTIVVLNEADKMEILKKNSNVLKIYNPSPFNSSNTISYNNNRKVVVALGRLHTEKNFEHLINAWSQLGVKTDGWTLKIYGKGEEYENLLQLININKKENIQLMGEIENVALAYAEAAFYVMTSKNEGLPMVLIEAQSNGIPIVSYDCPHGPGEIVNNEVDGFLVENQNIDAFSDALFKMLSSFELREKFSKESLKSSLRFSGDKILAEWKTIL